MARHLTYSVPEAAEVLGLSEHTVRRAIYRGALPTVPAVIAGSRTLIPVAALEAQMAGITADPHAAA